MYLHFLNSKIDIYANWAVQKKIMLFQKLDGYLSGTYGSNLLLTECSTCILIAS